MNPIPYFPTDRFYKDVPGAVETERTFRLRLVLPRAFGASAAYLYLYGDGETAAPRSMYWAGMYGDDHEIWDISLSVGEPGLYFYHFQYDSAWGRGGVYHNGDGVGELLSAGAKQAWQLTVYDKAFRTPDWLKGGLMYQIFPDRFYNSGEPKQNVPDDRILRTDTQNPPYWKPDETGEVRNNDYFGGDLPGICEKLPYLESLGVTCLYLNPVFEAHANHRYNTADYEKIDPLLGTEADFKKLCRAAQKHGIRVVLDGVFSHTGSDSRYFNREGRYDTVGAYNAKESPYFSWYSFTQYPEQYKSWWGFETLPEVNETDPAYLAFITGENGVVRRWLRAGAAGWRLDVADELPDEFLDALRRAAKAEKPDALVLGEVWEDATTKWAYGARRHYLLGGQLDSVMNYPFANAVLEFARGGDAEGFYRAVSPILEHYPKPVLDVLMNHIGTHDTERAITYLAGERARFHDRAWQAAQKLSDEAYQKGKRLLKLAAVLQYTLPGVPCLYYGDEAGMQGYKDPFNRGYYPWGGEDEDLLAFYRRLGALRRALPELGEGTMDFVSHVLGCVAYARRSPSGALLVIANRNEHDIVYNLREEWHFARERLHDAPVTSCVRVGAMDCVLLDSRG